MTGTEQVYGGSLYDLAKEEGLDKELLEQQLSAALPANRTSVMLARCQYAMTTAETVEDIEATRRMFEELIPLLPEGQAAEIRHYTDIYFRDPVELLRMLKASRPR